MQASNLEDTHIIIYTKIDARHKLYQTGYYTQHVPYPLCLCIHYILGNGSRNFLVCLHLDGVHRDNVGLDLCTQGPRRHDDPHGLSTLLGCSRMGGGGGGGGGSISHTATQLYHCMLTYYTCVYDIPMLLVSVAPPLVLLLGAGHALA